MKNYFILIFCLVYIIGCKKKDPEPVTPTPLPTATVSLGKWLQKSSFPGESRYGAFGFSLNEKIYIGGGHQKTFLGQNRAENIYNDFWEYDPSTDTWTQKADFPFPGILFVVSFTIEGKGYITTGITDEPNSNEYTYSNALWEYNPLLDEWKQKASFPGTPRIHAVGFHNEHKGYIALGNSASARIDSTYYNDLWQYDAITDSWSQKQSFTAPKQKYAFSLSPIFFSLSAAQHGYVILSDGVKPNTCWSYNFSSDEWTKEKDLEVPTSGGSNFVGTGFILNDQLYYKPAYISSDQPLASYTSDFWMYDAKKDDWLKRAFTPGYDLPARVGFAVKNKGYLLLGHNFSARSLQTSNEVWEYTPE